MDFMNAMKDNLDSRKTLTDNGAVAYATSGKELLDFCFDISGMRNMSEPEIAKRFARIYYENKLLAVKFLFWARDCRGGAGERRLFRICMQWLAENAPGIVLELLELIPEYGRYDDWLPLLDTKAKDAVVDIIQYQIFRDINDRAKGNSISLLAKWLPSANTSSKVTRRYANLLMHEMSYSPRSYRKILSALRKYLDVTECKMSANNWSEINYEAVPSKANLLYGDAFMRHDNERRCEYLDSLAKGEAKINASVLTPADIVSRYMGNTYYYRTNYSYNETLEQLWNNLTDVTIGNTLVIHDGSGSMYQGRGPASPIVVATALSIYMAEHNDGIWKNKFITFSSNPHIIDLSNCDSLLEKVQATLANDDCSNTNIEKTMMLILDTAVANKCSQEDMPGRVVIVSDMQWDEATYGSSWYRSDTNWKTPDKALFDDIADRYKNAGYKLPQICFWNVAAESKGTIPMQRNELGVVLASGYTVQIMNMFMTGETDPYKALLDVINAKRYAPVEEAIKRLI